MDTLERMRACLERDDVRAPRACAIANLLRQHGYTVLVHEWTTNTDRPKPAGLRYRTHIGKGREGLRIRVWLDSESEALIDHTTSETYRTNKELAEKALALIDRKD